MPALRRGATTSMARYFVLLDISHRRSGLWHALLGGRLDLAPSVVLECLLALASTMRQTCGNDDSTVWERTTALDACVETHVSYWTYDSSEAQVKEEREMAFSIGISLIRT